MAPKMFFVILAAIGFQNVVGRDGVFPPAQVTVGNNGLNITQRFRNPDTYWIEGVWAWWVVGKNDPSNQESTFFRSSLTFVNGTGDPTISCGLRLRNSKGALAEVLAKSDIGSVSQVSISSFPIHPHSIRTLEFVSSLDGSAQSGYAEVGCYSEKFETLASEGVSITGSVREYSADGKMTSEMFNRISFAMPTNKWVIPLDEGEIPGVNGTEMSLQRLGIAVALAYPGAPQYNGGDWVNQPVTVRFTIRDDVGAPGPVWEGVWQPGAGVFPHLTDFGEVRGIVLGDIFGEKLFYSGGTYGRHPRRLIGALTIEALGQTVGGKPIPITVLGNRVTYSGGKSFWVSTPALPIKN